jgi:hypothetical protein
VSDSIYCYAIKPADAEYQKKRAAYEACKAAGIPIPLELEEFFNGAPDPTGTQVCLGASYNSKANDPCCKPWKSEMEDGFEVDIRALPAGTRYVRFVCSY